MSVTLHESDFYAWTQQQAAALRRIHDMRINLPNVDIDNISGEIEDMGNDTLAKIEGLVVPIIIHLLKLTHAADQTPRNHWVVEVTAWRTTVELRARRSPTALSRLEPDRLTGYALNILRKDARTLPGRLRFPASARLRWRRCWISSSSLIPPGREPQMICRLTPDSVLRYHRQHEQGSPQDTDRNLRAAYPSDHSLVRD